MLRGLLEQTKQPPKEMSEVTPSAVAPDSRSIKDTSAAKGNRIAYRRSRTESPRSPSFDRRSSIEITFFTVLGPQFDRTSLSGAPRLRFNFLLEKRCKGILESLECQNDNRGSS